MIEAFHFLRPWLLLLLIPVCTCLFIEYRRTALHSSWQSVVDPQLLRFQLGEYTQRPRRWPLLLAFIAAVLTVVALAGPAWEQRPVPVFRDQQARVMVLDVSRSMDAADITPSRIARARFKLRDLLARSQGVQVGLIAFGAAPYVISPLTDDTNTIAAMVPSLTTAIVPVQGSDLGAALEEAAVLMRGAGVEQGQVILLTDSTPTEADFTVAARLRSAGHSVSVLAIGTEQGAPIPDQGSYLKDASGNIVIPGVTLAPLRQLAAHGGGQFSRLRVDDTDIAQLLSADNPLNTGVRQTAQQQQADSWIERGPWLLLPLLIYVALLFRRGLI